MRFAKKVAIAVELDNELYEVLKDIRDMDFLNRAEVNIVHVSTVISYSFAVAGLPLSYPLEEDRERIRETVMGTLKKKAAEFLPDGLAEKVHYHCLFSEDPKRGFAHYVEKNGIDLVIVATKQKHGFFESSFAHYVNKQTKADVLMLKKN